MDIDDLDERARASLPAPFVPRPQCLQQTPGGQCYQTRGHDGECHGTPTLTQVLEFEEKHAHLSRSMKAGLILAAFRIHPTRYYQLLYRYAATEEALQERAITAHRVNETAVAAVDKRPSRQF